MKFSNARIIAPVANGICKVCLENQGKTLMVEPGKFIFSYCSHNRTAGMVSLSDKKPTWVLRTPVDADNFIDEILDMLLALSEFGSLSDSETAYEICRQFDMPKSKLN